MSVLLPVYISGAISIIGVFISVMLTWYLNTRANKLRAKIQTTLEMHKYFQSITSHRIKAVEILERQLRPDEEREYQSLRGCMAADDWQHISITRHFFTELTLLHYAERLDSDLARKLFSANFMYWHHRYFRRLKVNPYGIEEGTGIHIPSDKIASWLGKESSR